MGLFGELLGKVFTDKFEKWMKSATYEELDAAYEKRRIEDFMKIGEKTFDMKRLEREMAKRTAQKGDKDRKKSVKTNYHWTDANRWDKD